MGILEMPIVCEINVIMQEGLKIVLYLYYISIILIINVIVHEGLIDSYTRILSSPHTGRQVTPTTGVSPQVAGRQATLPARTPTGSS